MGLEIANEKREVVTLGEIVRSKAYDDMHSPLALALGKDIGGHPVVADLARMPHLLIAARRVRASPSPSTRWCCRCSTNPRPSTCGSS